MYVFGVVLMMGADGQKYFTLREKRKLLNDAYMKWTRNPNYVGEMLLYASFAVVVQRWEPWIIIGYVWAILFSSRMIAKEYSLTKKIGFEEYASHSWMLLIKFGGSTVLSIVIYAFLLCFGYFLWTNGGIELGTKKLIAMMK